jgi:hypothetical protein
MSEERDDFTQDPNWDEQDYNKDKFEDQKREPDYSFGMETSSEPETYSAISDQTQQQNEGVLTPEEEEKKKKRKKILIIIFAIVLPVSLAAVGLGFLIWGLVVGFTNCINSCGNCFDECFSCCNTCDNCGNCCNDCTNNCTDCGNSCDNCCGSSEAATISLKNNLQNTANLIKWHFYNLIELIEELIKF